RDRAGLPDRGRQAFLAQVGGTCAALALAEIDGDRDAAVTGGLDRLDLAHAHVHLQPAVLAAGHLGLAGAGVAAALDKLSGDALKVRQALAAVVVDWVWIGDRGGQCLILGVPGLVQLAARRTCAARMETPAISSDRAAARSAAKHSTCSSWQ